MSLVDYPPAYASTTHKTKHTRKKKPREQPRQLDYLPDDGGDQVEFEHAEMTGHQVSRFIEGEPSTSPPPFAERPRRTKPKRKQRAVTEYSTFPAVYPPPAAPFQAAPSGTWPVAVAPPSPPEEGAPGRYRADSSASDSDSLGYEYGYPSPPEEAPPPRQRRIKRSGTVKTSFSEILEDTYVYDPTIYEKEDEEVYDYDENGHRIHHHHRPHLHSQNSDQGPRVSKTERFKAFLNRGRETVDVWKQPLTETEKVQRDARRQARTTRLESYGG